MESLEKILGVVAIGRNEGDRLIRCLDSLKAHLSGQVPIVYVDSGSTDNSLAEAKARGVSVIELDMSIPFTGARARNAGFEYLCQKHPQMQYVQFIDGDCELLPQWIEVAIAALEQSPELAIVFGRLQERFPEASPYNQVADMEWNVPVGEANACGGISLMRALPVRSVGGFNEAMICGEEPELCIRLRQKGWKLRRLDADMAIHDIDMHHFSQWWKRSVRGGWAVAEGAAMYGATPEHYMRHQNISGWLWGAALPLVAIGAAGITHGVTLFLLTAYGLLLLKIYRHRLKEGETVKKAWLYAFFCTVSKVPQAIGQGKYWINRWQQQPATLIEYKG
jgi:glycosyltransferase involved in cell wall biosynthesis